MAMPVLPTVINKFVDFVSRIGSGDKASQQARPAKDHSEKLTFTPADPRANQSNLTATNIPVVPVEEVSPSEISTDDPASGAVPEEVAPQEEPGLVRRAIDWLTGKSNDTASADRQGAKRWYDYAFEALATGAMDLYQQISNLISSYQTVSDVIEDNNLADEVFETNKAIIEAYETGDPQKIAEAKAKLENLNHVRDKTVEELRATGELVAIALADRLVAAENPAQILAILNDVENARTDLAEGNYGRLLKIAITQENIRVVELEVKALEAAARGDTAELGRIASELEATNDQHDEIVMKIDSMVSSASETEVSDSVRADIIESLGTSVSENAALAGILLGADREMGYLEPAQRETIAVIVDSSIPLKKKFIERQIELSGDPVVDDLTTISWAENSLDSLELLSATILYDSNLRTEAQRRVKEIQQEIEELEEKAIARRAKEKEETIERRIKKQKERAHIISIKLNSVRLDEYIENGNHVLLQEEYRQAKNRQLKDAQA